jgi:hypothetical protein
VASSFTIVIKDKGWMKYKINMKQLDSSHIDLASVSY